MAFGPKTKTLSRLASLNKMVHKADHASFKSLLLADPVLTNLQQEMVTMEGEIRAKEGFTGSNSIQRPPTVPVPTARWMGRLPYDTTTEGTKNGKKIYTYDHKSAFALNAQVFRDRIDTLLKLTSMENDLGNKPDKPNPGGQAGTHFEDGEPNNP